MLRNYRFIFVLLYLLCAITIAAQQDTLFSLSFEDPTKTPAASGSTTVKTLATDYGDIKYLDISFHNEDKIYHQIEIFGWIEFRSGSETINTTNSYIELPPITFANGGNFFINYGAGSTGRQLRLQEWNGSAWVNGTYAELNANNTDVSSTWYQKNWTITGAGTKIFRLVMSSSPPMNVTEIVVTGDMGVINVDCADTLNFGAVNINTDIVTKSINVTGNSLTSNIYVSPTLPYKISTVENGAYYSSVSIPPGGGTVYVKYQPTVVGQNICPLTLSSPGALNKTVILKGNGIYLNDAKAIISLRLNGYTGVINEAEKKVTVYVASNFDFTDDYSPTITVSAGAVLLPHVSEYFTNGIPIIYQVKAQDGSIADYEVTIIALSKENYITSFILDGTVGDINEVAKTITVNVSSSTNLSVAYTPSVIISANATLLTTGATIFTDGVPVTYTVKAEDGSLCNYQVTVNQLSGENDITTFNLNGFYGVIDNINKTIIVTVSSSIDLSIGYTPSVIVSANATLLTTWAAIFTNGVPVTFSVQAEDGSLCNYQVTVNQLSKANQITLFLLNGNVGDINEAAKTITVTVFSSTDLSVAHTPTVIVSSNATLLTTGATIFTDGVPVTYTVRAEDGSLANYQVTINQLSKEKRIFSFLLDGVFGTINEAAKTITVTVNSSKDLSIAYTPSVNVSANATLITTGATIFTNGVPVTYTVRAEDGSLANYQVTVNQLSGKNQITLFVLNGVNGNIDEETKTVIVTVPSNTDLSLLYTPIVEVSEGATLLTTGPKYFKNGIPVLYTVQAEDGSLCDYQVTAKTAVEDELVALEKPVVYSFNDKIIILTPQNLDYYVYAVNGTLIQKGITNMNDRLTSSSFNKGVYVVIVNGESYKVVIK